MISSEPEYGPLCAGHLAEAALHLAEHGRTVGIVTGFYIPHAEVPAAETDGPLGALMLAATLESVGMNTLIITDQHCAAAISAGRESVGLSDEHIVIAPDDAAPWVDDFLQSDRVQCLSHLIAVERVGPGHTGESLSLQSDNNAEQIANFLQSVPPESRGRCHNMRGQIIDAHTPELHRLFEELPRVHPQAKTVGIGDGANEIGMGVVPWEELVRRLASEVGPRIPCRIATNWNIIAGTSNWGAYALAAAVALLKDASENLQFWDADHQQQMLEAIVTNGPAVDGVTGRKEATVDGLPFLTFIQPWLEMRRLLGLND